ncbi:MAG: hypothetical protein KTR14_07140 [Vampirovibrio sp.]|nr:hypothetical protein [Vampirovibrio sp.]
MSVGFACKKHVLEQVFEHGKILVLEDDSLWQVADTCRGKTTDWKKGMPVYLSCEDQKIKRTDIPENQQQWVTISSLTSLDAAKDEDSCGLPY